MLRIPREGLSTEGLIVAVGQSYNRSKQETTEKFVRGQMTEERTFCLAFGNATREIDLALTADPTFDLSPVIRFTVNYFREKNKRYFLGWLAKLNDIQTSEDGKITTVAARVLEEAKKRRIYPPRRRR